MSEPTPEQMKEQTEATRSLLHSSARAAQRAHEFALAIDRLREDVTAAHEAGIPKEEVRTIVLAANNGSIPAEVSEHLRVIIRRVYI
jgi:hypothetical protein